MALLSKVWGLCFRTDTDDSLDFSDGRLQSEQIRLHKMCRIASTVVASTAFVTALAFMVFMQQNRAPVRAFVLPSERKYAAPSPGFYWFCPDAGFGQCGGQMTRRWRYSPAVLANTVPPDFWSLPGIAPGLYNPIAAHWQATPPAARGGIVKLSDIAAFVKELLLSDPFGTGGDNVPYVNFQGSGNKVVAITQRQLAFIVANVLMGNALEGGDGLSATIERCSSKGAGPGKGGFIYSLLSFLAVLSQELPTGAHGTMLIAGTPRAADGSWQYRMAQTYLGEPTVWRNDKDPSVDFMSGSVPFQAVTDIAGTDVGGGSQLCDIANSQDESMVQFYSETLAFSFFVSAGQMLPVPWALLGARNYMHSISGQSSSANTCGEIQATNWLNSEILQTKSNVPLNGVQVSIMASAFIAVASKSTDALHACDMTNAMNNNCYYQRHHLDADLALWYQAYEHTMYHPTIAAAFATVVRRIGTGPWGAGEWHGDSQQYFLTVWLATSLLGGVALDYYVYSHFCENPGNQCFVLGAEGCADCIANSGVTGVQASYCGSNGVHYIISTFQGQRSQRLYGELFYVHGPPHQVFDLLAPASPATAVFQVTNGIVQTDESQPGDYNKEHPQHHTWVTGILMIMTALVVTAALATAVWRERAHRMGYMQLPMPTDPSQISEKNFNTRLSL